jgi:hypothetical protein
MQTAKTESPLQILERLHRATELEFGQCAAWRPLLDQAADVLKRLQIHSQPSS